MKFIIEKEVFEKLPTACFGVVVAKGVDNTGHYEKIDRMLDESIAMASARFEGKKVKEEPDIIPYREAFRALDINPNKYMCSAEALFTRIAKGKGMPHINPAVDLGNALSLKYKLPIGAHDMYTFVKPDGKGRGSEGAGISIRPSTADDHFRPFGAPEGEFDDPEPGEVVYVSGNEIRTRRWTWRQSEQGKMQDKTSAVFYPIDGFADHNLEDVKKVMKDFTEQIANYFARSGSRCTVATGLVTKDEPRFEF